MPNPLKSVTSWLYHLGNVDAAEAAIIGSNNAQLVVIDSATTGEGTSRPHTPSELQIMRGGQDKLIVSYISIGEAEDYRSYWQPSWNDNPPNFLSASNPEWPDNFKVKYWDPQWQDIIFKYVDQIVDSGFNGVYMDIIDAYQYWEEINPVPGMNYGQEMADFVAAIRSHALAKLAAAGDTRDFVVLGQNGESLLANSTYLNAIDGVGKEDLRFYYENGHENEFQVTQDDAYTASQHLLEFAEANDKQVFVVEYMTQARQSQYAGELGTEHNYLDHAGIPLYVAEDRDLTHVYQQPYPDFDIINGTDDADFLQGTDAANAINGFAGNDIIDGGRGADLMDGGTGHDTYFVDNAGDTIVETNTADFKDRVFSSISYTLNDSAQVEYLGTTAYLGTASIDLTGNGYRQQLYGNAGANVLDGGGGGDGLSGQGGDDTYYIRNYGDAVYEAAGGGQDRIFASVSYILNAAAEVESLSTTDASGTDAINIYGNGFDQSVAGNAGVNFLAGKAGNDTLTGFGGRDYFTFDTPLDASTNVDVITDFTVVDDIIRIDDAIFTTADGTGPGGLGYLIAGQFAKNTTGVATEADDRIIYNTLNGWLSYDEDGVDGASGIHFATIAGELALTNADFYVI